MTGRTGYTSPAATGSFNPPADMDAIYAHFDPLIGETVATTSDLPASGNWVGRSIFVATDANGGWAVYRWQGNAGWVRTLNDTGWQDATFATGYTSFDTALNTVQWRVLNNVAYWRGLVKPAAGGNFTTADAKILVLPPATTPTRNQRLVAFGVNTVAYLNVDYGITCITKLASATTPGVYISVEGVQYPVN